MIIMLNGSFGVGKSTTAEALRQRIAGSIIYDPEYVGMLARHLTEGLRHGEENTDDFQDIALWRSLTVAAAQGLWRRYQRPMIVPMTLAQPTYLGEIRAGLAACAPTHHFCLVAPLATVQRRLAQRGEQPGSWAWRKAERCVPTLDHPRYAQHIPTDGREVPAVVEDILARLSC